MINKYFSYDCMLHDYRLSDTVLFVYNIFGMHRFGLIFKFLCRCQYGLEEAMDQVVVVFSECSVHWRRLVEDDSCVDIMTYSGQSRTMSFIERGSLNWLQTDCSWCIMMCMWVMLYYNVRNEKKKNIIYCITITVMIRSRYLLLVTIYLRLIL